MKLVIQIPCLNEEQTLPATLAALPEKIAGVDEILVLIVDDGCTDGTVEVAERFQVDAICRHRGNQGLGRAFRSGLDQALRMDADIIVNTDADGQYNAADIPALIAPILCGEADIVVGDRQTHKNSEFGALKKLLQRLGSHVVRALSGADIPDAVSGFRAISRDAAMRLNILSKFSYTIEMIIQAKNKQMKIISVPVRTHPKTRESRLFNSLPLFIAHQLAAMIRMYAMYRPMRFFFYIGCFSSLLGLLPIARFFIAYLSGDGSGKIQSLILGGILLTVGAIVLIAGLLADLIAQNRQINEIALEKIRAMEFQRSREEQARTGP